MTPVFAWIILYTIAVRTPIPCGNNVSCAGIECTWHCYTTNGQSHFVEFHDEAKALKFVQNLEPHNFITTVDKNVPDNKKFIYGLSVLTYVKQGKKWIQVNEHQVGVNEEDIVRVRPSLEDEDPAQPIR